jgi:hypothetical protein
VHEVTAAFAAWSSRSFPSTWMVQVGLASWILSIVSRISLIIYCPDWRLDESTAWIADELSVKTYRRLHIRRSSLQIVRRPFGLLLVPLYRYCRYRLYLGVLLLIFVDRSFVTHTNAKCWSIRLRTKARRDDGVSPSESGE